MPTRPAPSDSPRGIRAEGLPPISVVVCTKDRPDLLDDCLTALAGVRYPEFEVLVVDNASWDDRTRAVAERHRVRSVREERVGVDNARNRGFLEARHDIVAYVDDDVRVDPDWLSGVGLAFLDPGVDAVTGLVLPAEMETLAQELFELYGDGMSKGSDARVFRREDLTVGELIAAQHVGVGANMAVRRQALEDVGGFDPALDVGTPSRGGGDLDMFHRLLASGKTIRYEPSAVVRHRHRREMGELSAQLYDNGRSFGVYLLKLLSRRTVPRRSVVAYAVVTWGPWLVGRLLLGLVGLHGLPARLLWAEVRGALSAPFAFRSAYRVSAVPRSVSLEREGPGQSTPTG